MLAVRVRRQIVQPSISNLEARPMIKPQTPAGNPADVAENTTGYPDPCRAANRKRHNQRLCDCGKFSFTRQDGSSF